MNTVFKSLMFSQMSVQLCLILPNPAFAGGPEFSNDDPGGYGIECVFYEHRDFDGDSKGVEQDRGFKYVGRYWNDKISSITCHPICSITVYEHRDFSGASSTFEGLVSYVGDFWNDKISSLRVTCAA